MAEYWWIIVFALVVITAIAVGVTRSRSRSDGTAMEAYIEGLRSMIAGDRKNAVVKFRQAVDLDTGNIDAYLKLGDLFRATHLVDKALQIHRELTLRQGVSPELRAEIRKSLVEDYIEAGIDDKGIDMLRQMIKNNDNKSWAEDRLLTIYIRAGIWSEAEELYRGVMKNRGIKSSTEMSYIRLMLGRQLHDTRQFHKARLLYKEAMSANGKDPFAYLYIAESYLQEDRINDGLEYLKKLCENSPRYSYLAFPMIEETLFNLGRFSEVEDIYRGVLSRDPGNIPATVALSGILEKKGEIPVAENLLRSVLYSDKSSEAASLRLAKLLADSDRIEEGMSILSEMTEKINTRYENFVCKKCGKIVQAPLPYCRECGSLGSYL